MPANCHGDICPGNICPGYICLYQQYLSYWSDFDQTFWTQIFRVTFYWTFFGSKIFFQHFFDPKFFRAKNVFGQKIFVERTFFQTRNFFQTQKFFQSQNLFWTKTFFWTKHFFKKKCRPKIFQNKNSDPNIFFKNLKSIFFNLDPKIFLGPIFFGQKNLLADLTYFCTTKLFGPYM